MIRFDALTSAAYSGSGTGQMILAPSLSEGLAAVAPLSPTRTFIIGGATLYAQVLPLPSVDRILLTRVLDPAFEDCDVFLPEFRDGEKSQEGPLDNKDGSSARWRQATHADLVKWVDFDVPSGIQEEKGVKYEFQMWVKDLAS